MNTPPTPNTDPSDLPPGGADERLLDALLKTAGETDAQRNERVERVLQAIDEQRRESPLPAVIGRIRPLHWLGPAGMVAAILIVMWVVWPGQSVESAQAAMARVTEVLQSPEHRRYGVTLLTAEGKRIHGTVDVAQGGRFLGQFNTTGLFGNPVTISTGCNGKQYWLLPPIGPVQVSDEPIGPMFPDTRDGDEPDAALLTLPRAIATLQEGYDIVYADADAPGMMRLIATRRQYKANTGKSSGRPVLAKADVIARRGSGEVVEVTFKLDQQFDVRNQAIQSITFTLEPDAETPKLAWYEHETHQTGRPVIER